MKVARLAIGLLLVALAATACGSVAAPSDGSGGPSPSSSALPLPSSSPDPSAAPPSPQPSGATSPGPSTSASPVRILLPPPSTEGGLAAVWVGDDRVVVGGHVGPAFQATILVFRDGAWSVATVPPTPGQVTGIAAFGDGLLAVGNSLPDRRTGWIWASDDGASWRVVATIDGAAIYDVAAAANAVVAVGARLDSEMRATAAVWRSTDGARWSAAKVGGAAGTEMRAVAPRAGGFVAVGHAPLGRPRPVWTTASGESWTAVANDLDERTLVRDVVAGDGAAASGGAGASGAIAVAGAVGRPGEQRAIETRSTDGAAWTTTRLSSSESYASAIVAAGAELAIAGLDGGRLILWTVAGDDRRATTLASGGADIAALGWRDGWGVVGVGARDGHHAVWQVETE